MLLISLTKQWRANCADSVYQIMPWYAFMHKLQWKSMDDGTGVTPIDDYTFRQKFLESIAFCQFFLRWQKDENKKNFPRFAKVITKFSCTWFLQKPTLFTCIYWVQAHIMSTVQIVCTGAIACHYSGEAEEVKDMIESHLCTKCFGFQTTAMQVCDRVLLVNINTHVIEKGRYWKRRVLIHRKYFCRNWNAHKSHHSLISAKSADQIIFTSRAAAWSSGTGVNERRRRRSRVAFLAFLFI